MLDDVTAASFADAVLALDRPVLVDFWAPWCAPCRMVAPLVEELAVAAAGRLRVVRLNTDEHPAVPKQYGIRSIPTLIVFQGGREILRLVGFTPRAALQRQIAAVLAGAGPEPSAPLAA